MLMHRNGRFELCSNLRNIQLGFVFFLIVRVLDYYHICNVGCRVQQRKVVLPGDVKYSRFIAEARFAFVLLSTKYLWFSRLVHVVACLLDRLQTCSLD